MKNWDGSGLSARMLQFILFDERECVCVHVYVCVGGRRGRRQDRHIYASAPAATSYTYIINRWTGEKYTDGKREKGGKGVVGLSASDQSHQPNTFHVKSIRIENS